MSASALVLMILAIVLVWGGLAVATIYLMKHVTPFDEAEREDELGAASGA